MLSTWLVLLTVNLGARSSKWKQTKSEKWSNKRWTKNGRSTFQMILSSVLSRYENISY
jgi:hypothetical protein